MKKMQLQKLSLAAIALFLMVSCSKDDAPAPGANLPKVTIGTQVWAAKNLDVATYSDGTPIPEVTDATAWQNLTTGAWCYYENNTATGTTYGKLYNWYAVAGIHDNDPNTPNKKLPPTGWHIPSIAEWNTLNDFLGPNGVGGKMKEIGTAHWYSPNTGAANSSGFTGLPGGYRTGNSGNFDTVGNVAFFWSSSEHIYSSDRIEVFFYSLVSAISEISGGTSSKADGMSVRCLKD